MRRLDHHRHPAVQIGQKDDPGGPFAADIDSAQQSAIVHHGLALFHLLRGARVQDHGFDEGPVRLADDPGGDRSKARIGNGVQQKLIALHAVFKRQRHVLPFVQFRIFLPQLDVLAIDGEDRADIVDPLLKRQQRRTQLGQSRTCPVGEGGACIVEHGGFRLAEESDDDGQHATNSQGELFRSPTPRQSPAKARHTQQPLAANSKTTPVTLAVRRVRTLSRACGAYSSHSPTFSLYRARRRRAHHPRSKPANRSHRAIPDRDWTAANRLR